MPIGTSSMLRPLPGRLDDFISRLGDSKRIMERAGAKVSFYRMVAGSESEGVLYVSEVEDWDAYAKCAKKIEADKDWEALDRLSANDPAAEMLSTGILQEFTLS